MENHAEVYDMPMQRFTILLVFALSLLARADESTVANDFATPFRDNAVLQRDCDLPVFGTAAPGARVAVFFDGDVHQTVSDKDGKWRIVLPPQKAGLGHHLTLLVEGRPVKILENIAIGDVWVCSGGTDMVAAFFHNMRNTNEELQDADYPGIRFFQATRSIYPAPQDHVLDGAWQPCFWEYIRGFSSVAFFFGRNLHKKLEIPIGLLCANWDDVPVAAWLPVETAATIPGLESAAAARTAAVAAWLKGGELSFETLCAAWDASYDPSDPYEKADVLPGDEDFEEDAAWVSTEVPGNLEDALDSPQFDGIVWYRRSVFLSADQAAKKATVRLGHVDDQDVTWLNGVKLGENSDFNALRAYPVAPGILHAGANTLAVRVQDNAQVGGLNDAKNPIAIQFDDGTSFDLTKGLWKCRANKAPKGPRPVNPMVDPRPVGACYNGQIHPFAGMAVRGFLWAVGTGDYEEADAYGPRFEALVRDWRSRFTGVEEDLPFYLLQPVSTREHHNDPFDSPLATIRWAAEGVGRRVPNVFPSVCLDDGNPWQPYSYDKRVQGDRLAALALQHTYGLADTVAGSPFPVSATLQDGKVAVRFENATPLATSDDKAPEGFQLAGTDGTFAWASAVLSGDTVLVTLPEGMETPAVVRYAWDDCPHPPCNLVGANKCPVDSFELPVK